MPRADYRGPSELDLPTPNLAFRDYLVAHRKRRGISQAVLANMMGTSQSAVSDLEIGEIFNPTLGLLVRWATALEVEISIQLSELIHRTYSLNAAVHDPDFPDLT